MTMPDGWRACRPLEGAAALLMHSSTTTAVGGLQLLAQMLVLMDWLIAVDAQTLRDRLREAVPGCVLTVQPCCSGLCLRGWLSYPPALIPPSI